MGERSQAGENCPPSLAQVLAASDTCLVTAQLDGLDGFKS
jgi:hypothetical protein